MKTTTIFIGQKLFVSDKKAVKATTVKKKATVHTVKKGDTLTKVSKQYNVTIKNLKNGTVFLPQRLKSVKS
ncbi:LysM peptidoglycan-binding domain-containing protein [Kurthia senegalensis]|uniref:LysM peptidoglycan-binding domain-containing protein n=1 Tax=Kurthia senegalensis TaxID=1033740 RepID=UPI000287A9A2|nr:LysM peptidoglycan-binding domain-containing protein [Kurthia senegalensis]